MNQFKKQLLPEPVLPERNQWIELYYKAFEVGSTKVRTARPWNPDIAYIEEGFNQNLFQWDSCLMMHWCQYLQGAYTGLPDPMITLENFYSKQHDDGAICREIVEATGEDYHQKTSPEYTNPPLFSWTEWNYFVRSGDDSRLERVLPILDNYFHWCRNNRTRTKGHYWWDNLGSGMDNSPRNAYAWVDYTACSALDAYYIHKISKQLGHAQLAEQYLTNYISLKTLINTSMWDQTDEMYWDLNQDGSYNKTLTIASFWPLLSQISSFSQQKSLIKYLESSQFKTYHRIPTLASDHPEYNANGDYWHGSVWAPTNYMVIKGLEYNGHHDLAREIAINHLECMAKVFNSTQIIWENYSPSLPERGSQSRKDFCGWSALGPITLLIENIIGIKKNIPQNTIHWHIGLDEEHGLNNLIFNEKPINFIFKPHSDSAEVAINSTVDFHLRINYKGKTKKYLIYPGMNKLSL